MMNAIMITAVSEITIDGKLSIEPRTSSKNLTSYAPNPNELKQWAHQHRSGFDMIMVGAGTIRTDDPELTVRYAEGPNPIRVIPSTEAKLPLNAKVLNDGLSTIIVTSQRASQADITELTKKNNVKVLVCGEREVNFPDMIEKLSKLGFRTMLVEGGGTLFLSLFKLGMISKLVIKHIPIISGRNDAPTYLGHPSSQNASCNLTKWHLDNYFIKGGIAISEYSQIPQIK